MSHKHYLTGISPRKQQSCPGGSTLELKRESWRVNRRVVDDDHSCKSVWHLINLNPSHFTFWFRDHKLWKPKTSKNQKLCLFLRLRQQIRLSTASLDAFKKQSKTNVALCISAYRDEKCVVSVSCLARSCLKEISVPSSQTSKHQKHIMIYIAFKSFAKFLPHPTSPDHLKWSSCYNSIGFWAMVLWQKNVSKQQNSQQTPSELASGFSVKVVWSEVTGHTALVSSCQRLQPQTHEENKESRRKPHGNVFENLIEAVCWWKA